MNRYNKYLLEKRISRLERYFYESGARNKAPSIFSKDIEEVKAAVERGKDINSRNRSGKTPLHYICTLSNRDDLLPIIKYLVENGADLNPTSSSLITLALNSNNIEMAKYLIKAGAPVDHATAVSAISKDLPVKDVKQLLIGGLDSRQTHSIIDELHTQFYRHKITRDEYLELLNKQLSFGDITVDNANATISNYMIADDLSVKITIMSDYLVDKLGMFPMTQPISAPFEDMSKSGMELFYKYAKMISSRNLKVRCPYDFFYVIQLICIAIKKDFSELGLVDEDFFKEIAKENPKSVGLIAADAFNRNNTDLLKTIYNCGNLHLKGLDNFIDGRTPDSLVNLYMKILTRNKYKDFSEESLRRIGKYSHKVFVEYIIDLGLAEEMINICGPQLSDQAKEALAESGISIEKNKHSSINADSIYYLISLIESDESFVEVEQILKKNPELLENSDVIEAITNPDNDHSFTARELRKRLHKEDSIYDF